MMRSTRLLALSLLAALVFSACGAGSTTISTPPAADTPVAGGNSSPSPSPVPSLTPTPLPPVGVDQAALRGVTIQVWHAFAGPAANLFASQAAQFNASNQWGIVVTPSGYGDYTSLFEAMNSALDAGNAADLVATLPEQTLAFETLGKVVDLQPYLVDPQWLLGNYAIAFIPSFIFAHDYFN